MPVFAFFLVQPVQILAQQPEIEKKLKEANIILSELPDKIDNVREWLLSDPAYRALAAQVLKILEGKKVLNEIPLEVINGKFKALMGKSYNEYVTADEYHRTDLIKMAIYKTWKERHPSSERDSLEDILMDVKKYEHKKPQTGSDIRIEVDYPKKNDEVPVAEFVGKGKVISKVELKAETYIFGIIKTDLYYRQGSQKLLFTMTGSKWTAPWEIDLVLGRPADIGLEGTLHLFVVNREDRKRLIKHYLYPKHELHSEADIPSLVNLEWPIERSIPE